jgi:hypothetical protein
MATKYEQKPIEEIDQDETYNFSKECTTEFTVSSAKNNFNVTESFMTIASKIISLRPQIVKKN